MSRPWRLLREAARFLWSSRAYALLMMIGLIIGIASVTVIYELGAGVRERVFSLMANMGFGADAMFVSSGGGRLGLHRPGASARTITLEDVAAIARLDNVEMVSPQLAMRRDRVSHHDRHTSTFVVGVTPEYGAARRWEAATGRFLEPQDESQRRRVAVLGAATAEELFPGETPLGQLIQIGNVPLTVVGVLEAKGGASGSGRSRDDFILTPLSVSMRRLAKEDKVSGLRVNFSDPTRRLETAEEVRLLLRGRHKLAQSAPDDFTITTPDALVAIITRQARAMVVMLTFISAVSLFVSGIVIMNIMLVAVSERAHEIGVRRAVGARRGDILTQVLMESLMVSLVGGACGFGLGALLSWLCTLLFDLPTAFSPVGFGLAFAFSAGVGLFFGLFPARKAAALQPVESLR